ncbi:hypothetical protein ACFX13_034889 [Malus domestica]
MTAVHGIAAPESLRYSKSTRKISTFRTSDLEFRRWKEKDLSEKEETISAVTETRVCTRATSERSTGAKNASREGDLRRRIDENIAAEAMKILKKQATGQSQISSKNPKPLALIGGFVQSSKGMKWDCLGNCINGGGRFRVAKADPGDSDDLVDF